MFLKLYRELPTEDRPQRTEAILALPCAVTGCTGKGTFTTSTTGSDRWYCWNHFNGNTSSKPAREPVDKIQQRFDRQLKAELEEMQEIGKDEYIKMAKERRREFLNR